MKPSARSILHVLDRIAAAPAAAITRLADEADEIWEPFLVESLARPIDRSC